MKLQILATARHRHGISGSPFDVVLVRDRGPQGSRKVAVLFAELDRQACRHDLTETHQPERSPDHD